MAVHDHSLSSLDSCFYQGNLREMHKLITGRRMKNSKISSTVFRSLSCSELWALLYYLKELHTRVLCISDFVYIHLKSFQDIKDRSKMRLQAAATFWLSHVIKSMCTQLYQVSFICSAALSWVAPPPNSQYDA